MLNMYFYLSTLTCYILINLASFADAKATTGSKNASPEKPMLHCPASPINCYASSSGGTCFAELGPFDMYWAGFSKGGCQFVYEPYNESRLNACKDWGYPQATYATMGEYDPSCPCNPPSCSQTTNKFRK